MVRNLCPSFCVYGLLIASASLHFASSSQRIACGADKDDQALVTSVDEIRQAVDDFLGSSPGHTKSYEAVASAVSRSRATLDTLRELPHRAQVKNSVAFLKQVLRGMDGKCSHGLVAAALLEDAPAVAIDRSIARLIKEWSAAKASELSAGALGELATQIVNTGLYADKLGIASGDTLAHTAIFLSLGSQHELASDFGAKAVKVGIKDETLKASLASAQAKVGPITVEGSAKAGVKSRNGEHTHSRPTAVAPAGDRAGTLGYGYWKSWDKSPRFFANELANRNLPSATGHGVFLVGAMEGLAAEGLRPEDIIVRLNGIHLKDEEAFQKATQSLRAGKVVPAAVKRVNEPRDKWNLVMVDITPVALEDVRAAVAAAKQAEARVAAQRDEEKRQALIAERLNGQQYEYDGRHPKSDFRKRLEEAALGSDIPSLKLWQALTLRLSRSGLTLNDIDWAQQVNRDNLDPSALSHEERVKYTSFLQMTAEGF